MHDNWDTEITQCETMKNCVEKMSYIMLVQQKKSTKLWDLQSLFRKVVHNATDPLKWYTYAICKIHIGVNYESGSSWTGELAQGLGNRASSEN